MTEPEDPGMEGVSKAPLTGGPFLVKVDRYGSVSGLVEVEVTLGTIVIVDRMRQGRSIIP